PRLSETSELVDMDLDRRIGAELRFDLLSGGCLHGQFIVLVFSDVPQDRSWPQGTGSILVSLLDSFLQIGAPLFLVGGGLQCDDFQLVYRRGRAALLVNLAIELHQQTWL